MATLPCRAQESETTFTKRLEAWNAAEAALKEAFGLKKDVVDGPKESPTRDSVAALHGSCFEKTLAKLPPKASETAPGIELAAADFNVWLHQWAVDDNKVAKVWVERKYGKKKRPPTKM